MPSTDAAMIATSNYFNVSIYFRHLVVGDGIRLQDDALKAKKEKEIIANK
jgi:hypothetical protein